MSLFSTFFENSAFALTFLLPVWANAEFGANSGNFVVFM